MERTTYPFPLAVNSSHHSHYHRFLLGVDPRVLAPFPKPYCIGALSAGLAGLMEGLDLQRWRKLYHASFPWIPGYGPGHYRLGNVPSHRPLPPEYGRRERQFGAFDFVQIADPSVSALALVAGDRRVLDGFVTLSDRFSLSLEPATSAHAEGPSGSRVSARFLAGQFAEPSNRWLMPFLHVHSRVLNFTSFSEDPARLACIDSAALGRAARRELAHWPSKQAELLAGLGYRVSVRGEGSPVLRVEGVTDRLLAAMEAPRIAVLRILERMIVGDRPPSPGRLTSELPPAVVAAMAEQLEALVARSLSYHKPMKVGLPSEGPWRSSVREHLSRHCPGSLSALDEAARRSKAERYDEALVPAPAPDASHIHAPSPEPFLSPLQHPCDPELQTHDHPLGPKGLPSAWLAREFTSTLNDVNERIVRSGTDDRIIALRSVLPLIDQLGAGADRAQLAQADALLRGELERARQDEVRPGPPARSTRFPLASLDDLFDEACAPRPGIGHEIGGRSL
jgi:TrwC relaxase